MTAIKGKKPWGLYTSCSFRIISNTESVTSIWSRQNQVRCRYLCFFIAFNKIILIGFQYTLVQGKFHNLFLYWCCCAVMFWLCGISPIQNLTWSFLGLIFVFFILLELFVLFVSSGLNLAPVARLRTTWEKLPSKYEKLFQDLQDLFDPSRNMAKYRNVLNSQNLQPPIIPLFPVIKKDLTFLHEGKKSHHLLLAKENQLFCWIIDVLNFWLQEMIRKWRAWSILRSWEWLQRRYAMSVAWPLWTWILL